MNTQTRGHFSREQVAQLLNAVEGWRVVTGAHVKPHLSQQDVLAHLNRMFGFGNFDVEIISSELVYEEPMTNSNNAPAWRVLYRAIVRLFVRDANGNLVAFYDGGSTGESEGQPSRADSHDLAFKSALSTATKRAAIHLGDQFGLSLYNKGQMQALVMGTMVGADWAPAVLNNGPQQEVDGGRVAERQDAAAEEPQVEPAKPTALPPQTKRATTGRQGTRKSRGAAKAAEEKVEAPAPAPAPEPVAPAPAPTPAPEPVAPAPEVVIAEVAAERTPEDAERAERERMAAEQMRQVSDREAIIASADSVDRADEAAVAAWNAEHGKATGHFISSNAEMERQRAKMDAPAPAAAPAPAPVEDLSFVDRDGTVYASQEELDAAVRARVQGSIVADAGQVVGTLDANAPAFDEVVAASPTDYFAQVAAARTVEQTKDVWVRAQADAENPMTQELKMEILRVKVALEGQA